MTQKRARKRTATSGGPRSLASNPPWHALALVAVLALAAFPNLYRIGSLGYGNMYYAAAVKNMLTSPQNFYVVSFDAGFVSVDKPPLGLWVQPASAWLFGFHGWSLLLPQALARPGRGALGQTINDVSFRGTCSRGTTNAPFLWKLITFSKALHMLAVQTWQ